MTEPTPTIRTHGVLYIPEGLSVEDVYEPTVLMMPDTLATTTVDIPLCDINPEAFALMFGMDLDTAREYVEPHIERGTQ